MQRDIFDPENRTLNEAFQAMLKLDFSRAVSLYESVLKQHSGQEQTLEYSLVARSWERFFRQCDPRKSTDDRSLFFQEISEQNFESRPLQNLERALLKHLATQAEKAGQWWLDEHTHLGELYLRLNLAEKAEWQFYRYQQEHGPSAHTWLAMAWCQWLQGKQSPAARHYILGFFSAPASPIVQQYIPERLEALSAEHPVEWLPAYGWLQGVLPFLNPGDISQTIQPVPEEVFAVYSRLYHAEKARRSQTRDLVGLRKKLKEKAPESLFKGYMQRVQKQQENKHLW